MKIDTKQSIAYREQLRIGAQLRDCFDPVLEQAEVGDMLGISQQAVSQIERIALWKVAMELKRLARAEKI